MRKRTPEEVRQAQRRKVRKQGIQRVIQEGILKLPERMREAGTARQRYNEIRERLSEKEKIAYFDRLIVMNTRIRNSLRAVLRKKLLSEKARESHQQNLMQREDLIREYQLKRQILVLNDRRDQYERTYGQRKGGNTAYERTRERKRHLEKMLREQGKAERLLEKWVPLPGEEEGRRREAAVIADEMRGAREWIEGELAQANREMRGWD